MQSYKVYKLPHPTLIHWILNPGLAINEVLLGQRMPKVTLLDQTSNLALVARSFVPCDSCGAVNDGRFWSGRHAFGHWFGYVCPECGSKIPCLWNIFSLLILAVTSPLWIGFKLLGEKKMMMLEKKRLEQLKINGFSEVKKTSYLGMGIKYGVIMFVIMTPYYIWLHGFTPSFVVFSAVIWALGGLGFGLLMKFFTGVRTDKNSK